MLIVLGGGIGFSLLTKSIPVDPAVMFAEAIAASEKQDGKLVQEISEKLKDFPEYSRQQKLLEGMLFLGRSRPVKAIPFLKEASEEKSIRGRALMFLGTAYAQAEDPRMSISTFEMALSEDENANAIRQNLASMLTDLLAWDEALSQLSILVEKEYKLAQVLKMRADIRLDLELFSEAATDYAASIKADKNDPLNSLKAERLVKCLVKTGELQKADEYIEGVDQPGTADYLNAEKLVAADKSAEALVILQQFRERAPNDPQMGLMFGKIMLKQNTKEKAEEALVILGNVVRISTRDIELFRIIVDLAKIAGDDQLAGLAQQNVELLTEKNKLYAEKLAATIKTREDFALRMELGEAAHEVGRLEIATKVYDAIQRYYPDKLDEISGLRTRLYEPQRQLVNIFGVKEASEKSLEPGTSPTEPVNPPASPPNAG